LQSLDDVQVLTASIFSRHHPVGDHGLARIQPSIRRHHGVIMHDVLIYASLDHEKRHIRFARARNTARSEQKENCKPYNHSPLTHGCLTSIPEYRHYWRLFAARYCFSPSRVCITFRVRSSCWMRSACVAFSLCNCLTWASSSARRSSC